MTELDKEFESMMTVVKSNFVTVDSFASSMWSFLRQDLIRKLAHVKSTDQDTWIKTEDYIAGLLNDVQILTIENTDQTIKVFENCASRAIKTNTSVLLAEASHDGNPEMVTMRAELVEMTNGHNVHGCWFNEENKLKEEAKMKSDTEDILKSKKSNKKSLMSGFVPNEHNDECLNCVSLKCYRTCTDTYVTPSSRFHVRSKGPDLVFNLWGSRVMTFRLKSPMLHFLFSLPRMSSM
jgi:hypothetical protein